MTGDSIRLRAIVYVDGFNLYNGMAKPLNCKWVDLRKLFRQLLPSMDIVAVRFYTSMVDGPTQQNQRQYIAALESSHPSVTIKYGIFERRSNRCGVKACSLSQDQRQFFRPTEKRTDVCLASDMIVDAYENACDVSVLVSGDSDFVPAIELLRRRRGQRCIAFVPTLGTKYNELAETVAGGRFKQSGYATHIREAVDEARTLKISEFLSCQFPKTIVDSEGVPLKNSQGAPLRLPEDWKIAPESAYRDLMSEMKKRSRQSRYELEAKAADFLKDQLGLNKPRI